MLVRVVEGVTDLERQLDDPSASDLWGYQDAEPAERDRHVAETVELINHTLRDIPPEKIRYHTCYGINQGPHVHDLRLRDFIEPMPVPQTPCTSPRSTASKTSLTPA